MIRIVAGFLVAAIATQVSAQTPTVPLFQLSPVPHSSLTGVKTAATNRFPVIVNENAALRAVVTGGMWVDNPRGGRIYVRYVRRRMFPNGDWTFFGSVDTRLGPQSVVLTFGAGAVYGTIPVPKGGAFHVTTNKTGTWLEIRSGKTRIQRFPRPKINDAVRPKLPPGIHPTALPPTSINNNSLPTKPPGKVLVDVLVGYQPQVQAEYGSRQKVLTRLHYLFSYANQAYVNSKVNMRIRLTKAVEVAYDKTPEEVSEADALDALASGSDPSLKKLHALRDKYGADLVTLFRERYEEATGTCGIAYLAPTASDLANSDNYKYYSDAASFSVVSDGINDASWYRSCGDNTLAHELGHNMSLDHDQATLDGGGIGAGTPSYPYGVGYKQDHPDGGFYTIMAYGSYGEQPIQVFSNPSVTMCKNLPCGVADKADNARVLRQTNWWIAGYRLTTLGPFNVNGDTTSDIIWRSRAQARLVTWPMVGSSRENATNQSMGKEWGVLGVGDFNADGYADILWGNAKRQMKIWLGGKAKYVEKSFRSYNSDDWHLGGIGDVDGDGNDDLVWYNQKSGKEVTWFMKGPKVDHIHEIRGLNKAYRVMAVGDFNGDGRADILWGRPSRRMVLWTSLLLPWLNNGFKSQYFRYYASGWKLRAVGDINGDGRDDLMWYKQHAGRFVYWLMNGVKATPSRQFHTHTEYDILATGDFNGDHHADIVWGNNAHGLVMWTAHGSAFSSHTMGKYSPGDWEAVNWKGVIGTGDE